MGKNLTDTELASYLFDPKRWTPQFEIRRLWPHRQGEGYIRHLIKLYVSELRTRRNI